MEKILNAKKKRKNPMSIGENRDGYIFITPWLIGFFVFILVPFIVSFLLSFTDYSIMGETHFIGLENYRTMFTEDDKFYQALKVTFSYAFITVPLKLFVALMVAMLLNNSRRGIGLYRTAFYLPSLIGGSVAVAVVWKRLFANDGMVNAFLSAVGLTPVFWFTDSKSAIWTLIFLAVWQFGAPMLIFLSALKQISPSYYEAARIDGANAFSRFRKITLPMITPVLFYNLIMQLVGSFTTFTQCYIVTEGGPLNSTLFYGLYLYRKSFEFFDMGYGAALAWVLLVIIGFFTALVFKSSGYWVFYEEKGE